MRMKNIRCGNFLTAQPLQEPPHQQRLAGARFAGQHQKSTVRFDAGGDFRQGRFIASPGKKESWVGRPVKGVFPKPKRLKRMLVSPRWSRGHRAPEEGLRAFESLWDDNCIGKQK